MNKIKLLIIAAVIVIVAVAGMNFLASQKKVPKKQPIKELKRFVKAEKVRYKTIKSRLEASGRLVSQHRLNVISEVQGRILPGEITLKRGSSFKKGEILFRIYKQEVLLNHKARVSRFLNSVALILPDFKVDFKESFRPWEKFFIELKLDKDLPELPKINSPKEKVFLASRNILSEYYQIKSEELRLKKYTVKAPFSGTIIQVNLEVQSIANPGTVIAVVSRTDQLELEVPVNIKYRPWIKIGDPVAVHMENSEKMVNGVIKRVSNVIDVKTQDIIVFVQLKKNGKIPLYNGLYLKAIFSEVAFEKAMEIPRNAVFNNNQVYIVKNDRLKKREVEVRKVKPSTVILSGLREGEMIVTEALVSARENALVSILKK